MTFRARRSRGNDNVSFSVSSILPGIRPSLAAAVLGDPYAQPRKKPVVKIKARLQGKYPEAVVLEIRRLREQSGVMPKAIEAHLAELGYVVPRHDIISVLSYATRAHLVPAEGAEPYLKAKAEEAST